MKNKVHFCKVNQHGIGYAACSGWAKIPYTLLESAVTCKNCLKVLKNERAFKPIVFTRDQFTKMYGKHPDWMWEMLQDNYKRMRNEESEKQKS